MNKAKLRLSLRLLSFFFVLFFSQEAFVARMADYLNYKCAIKGADASSIVRFLGYDAKKSVQLDIPAHRGTQAPDKNKLDWNSVTQTLTLGDSWADWKTGTTDQSEGPQFQFQINAETFSDKIQGAWPQWRKALEDSKAKDFNAYKNASLGFENSKKFQYTNSIGKNEFLTLELYKINLDDPIRYGADKDGKLIFVSCGPWVKK